MSYEPLPYHLLRPAFDTPEMKQAEEAFLPEWLAYHNLQQGSQLYHYTTLAGLQGILRDRALWFGHVHSMNDSLEVRFGQDVVAGILHDFLEREERDNIRVFLRNLLMLSQGLLSSSYHIFACCFCGSSNLLSQWRAYSSGGGGYCLGIEFSKDTRIVSDLDRLKDGQTPHLRKIIYTEEEQTSLVRGYIEKVVRGAQKALESYKENSPELVDLAPGVMAAQAVNTLIDMLLCFKHRSFSSEEEWRVLRVVRDGHESESLQFRSDREGLIPFRPTYVYEEQPSAPYTFPLRSIGFGPMLDPARTLSNIKLLLQKMAAETSVIQLIPHKVNVQDPGYRLRGSSG